MRNRKVVAAAVVGAIAIPVGAAAVGPVPVVTKRGAGKVKLGAPYKKLHKKGALGKKIPGCELAGPGQKGALLKAPLEGAVNLSRKSPRKVRSISITGGLAQAKGVGLGDLAQDIEQVFPHARADHSTDALFEATFYRVPRRDGGKFEFAVSTKTGRIDTIGIPFIAVCE
jgi:hypothetical protein